MNDIEIAQAVSTILSKFTKATPDAVPAAAPATSETARVEGLDEIVAKALAQQSSGRAACATSQVANAGTGAFDTMDERSPPRSWRRCSIATVLCKTVLRLSMAFVTFSCRKMC